MFGGTMLIIYSKTSAGMLPADTYGHLAIEMLEGDNFNTSNYFTAVCVIDQ